jgi:hypothetical protein
MRNKIFAELVKKFPGLDKKFLGLIADKLAKKVTEESGIEQAITDYDNAASIQELATDFQKEGDRRVTDAKKEWEKQHPKKGKDKTEDDDEDIDDEDVDDSKDGGGKSTKKSPDRTPAWAKDLMAKVDSLQKEKTQSTIKQKAADLLKDVPEKFWNKRALPEKEEDLQAFADDVNADFAELVKESSDKGLTVLSTAKPSAGGSGGGGTDNKTISPEIKAYVEKNKPATAASK